MAIPIMEICGIVFVHSSKYSEGPEGRQSIKEVRDEATKHGWPVFQTPVRYSASYAKAAREGTPLENTSYVQYYVTAEFRKLVEEFFSAINLSKE